MATPLMPEAVAVLCALEVERAAAARTLRSAGYPAVTIHRTGPGQSRAAAAVGGLGDAVRVAVFFGVAGGLAEGAPAPPISRVVDGRGGAWETTAGPRVDGATLASVPSPVGDPAAKRILATRTGAALVDTESAGFAAACEGRGLRWCVVRGVSDGPAEPLPPGIERWVLPDGRTALRAVLLDLARSPRLVVEAAHLGRRTGAALRAAGERLVGVLQHEGVPRA